MKDAVIKCTAVWIAWGNEKGKQRPLLPGCRRRYPKFSTRGNWRRVPFKGILLIPFIRWWEDCVLPWILRMPHYFWNEKKRRSSCGWRKQDYAKAIRIMFPLQKRHRITISNLSMIHRRLSAVRTAMTELRLQAFLVTEMAHVRYLTVSPAPAGYVWLLRKKQFLITDRRYKSQAPQEVDGFIIIIAMQRLFPLITENRWFLNTRVSGSRVSTWRCQIWRI